ncbi:NAD(P)/FAD-dependent oxidoreductase [Nesterenkonia alkaliphila]|uniref:FAD-dependent oxidoreductase n=1 Tax=Nesterenkonia alkaliphila TaxID=1463631 RepID=A0A7K1UGR6_9MICC|nr:FAD-binding oxidoreductase [Nesterenkonia alkaliphila]MVT25576.1 FAD-dependent oxidoreductase [Nesterenkonia alkaliphila]GFZ95104.1 FAD-dependent oxidoreductase [Nesterenkonia alkaliphila]
MKTIVVGAGIVGVSVAYSLLNRGHEVTLVEAEEVAAGTTSTSYAWINSHKKHPESYHALNYEGLKHWTHVVSAQHPETVLLHGHVEFAVDHGHRTTLRQRLERLQSLDYAARWITPEEAAQLTPVQVPQDALVALFPWEGHAYPQQLAASRVAEMRRSPDFSLIIDPVTAITRAEGRVGLRSGTQLQGDVVVLAVGNSTTEVAAKAGIQLPMVPKEVGGAAFGYLAYVRAPDHGLQGPVTSDHLNLRPNGENGLILQALDLDATADPALTPAPEIAEEFIDRLQALLPAVSTELEEVRVGHRVIPGDGLTVAGPATEEPENRLWIAVTHSGVVLGPWLGEALAEEISTEQANPLFRDFRPTRFASAEQTPAYAAPRNPGDQ